MTGLRRQGELDYDELVADATDENRAFVLRQVDATLAVAYQLRTANLIAATAAGILTGSATEILARLPGADE